MHTDNQNQRPGVVKDSKGKRPAFYDKDGTDQLMSMVMVLASEVSALRDRLDTHERIAQAKGVDIAAEIDAFELDEPALQAREQRRQDFFERLFYLARKTASEAANEQTQEAYQSTIRDIASQ